MYCHYVDWRTVYYTSPRLDIKALVEQREFNSQSLPILFCKGIVLRECPRWYGKNVQVHVMLMYLKGRLNNVHFGWPLAKT